jgi:pyrroline-5-carboxylate reductase
MINISIYGAGHLTKSLLTGLGRVSDSEISIFNRTESKINNLNSIYRNLEKKDSLYELIKESTILFCIVPVDAIINLDLNVIEKLKQTNSILVSCANGLSLEVLNDKFSGLNLVNLAIWTKDGISCSLDFDEACDLKTVSSIIESVK